MIRRIPDDAFEEYFALGPERSYRRLAEKLGVSKQAISKRAKEDRWQQRIQEREERTREAVATRVEESIEALNARHLKILKAVQAKALEALKGLSMAKAGDVIRALEMSIRQERVIRGEPGGGIGISVDVTNHQVAVGPPVPENDALGMSIYRLSELARSHGLMDEGEDHEGEPSGSGSSCS